VQFRKSTPAIQGSVLVSACGMGLVKSLMGLVRALLKLSTSEDASWDGLYSDSHLGGTGLPC
jgi:hypothetical protein